VRTFNLGRIASLELLDERFQVPRGFTIERYLGNAWHLIPEPGRDEEVVIRFRKMVARNVAEVAWHKTQRLVRRDDGTLDFHITVSGLNEISWWILGYGDQAEVLEPARLRDMIAAHAARLVETYDVKPAQ
jgi:proteasome accessory factor B